MRSIILVFLFLFAAACTKHPTQGDLDDLESDVNGLESEVNVLQSDVGTIKTGITGIESRLAELEDRGYTDFYIRMGTLFDYNRDTINTVYYWKIYVYISGISSYDSCIVQTWVRQNAGYLWSEPTWYLYEGSDVRIIDDIEVAHGYEYKILVAYKHN